MMAKFGKAATAIVGRIGHPVLTCTVSDQYNATHMAKAGGNSIKTEPEIKLPTPQDIEIEYLMRASRRSRVQVLNAIKMRGPSREDILRALAR
jgi:hypothetical protein